MNWTFFIFKHMVALTKVTQIVLSFPKIIKFNLMVIGQYNHMVEFIGNLRYNTKGIVLSFSL